MVSRFFNVLCRSYRGSVADWAAIFLQERLNLTEAMAVSGFVTFSLAMFTGRMLADNLVGQFGAIRVCWFAGLLATLGLCIVLFVSSLGVVLIGFLLVGFGLAPVFRSAARGPRISLCHPRPGPGRGRDPWLWGYVRPGYHRVRYPAIGDFC